METATVAHDPLTRDDITCPRCNEPWPCPERIKQRAEWRRIRGVLQSSLYAVPPGPREREGWTTWRDPIGWTLHMTYGDSGIRARIEDANGALHAETEDATDSWVDHNLP